MRLAKPLLVIFTVSFAVLLQTLLPTSSVGAADASDFKPGRIIDDGVFYNKDAMSVGEIQAFLEDMLDGGNTPDGSNGNCDSNGTESYGGTTKAQYALNSYNNGGNGNRAPFVCLINYWENPNTGENNYYEYNSSQNRFENIYDGSKPSGSKSAAQLIYDVAQEHGINPQVLIVLLQKEQSLVTDDWAWGIQYYKATGYACPDTGPCDSEFAGFYKQLWNAARQFIRYRENPGNYSHVAGQNNSVRWHPNVSCGSSTVFIENQATAGLYNYTPYRPNSAALNNLYGSGNSCSSYGNRNFWRLFTDWFGSTYGEPVISEKLRILRNGGFLVGNDLTAEFTIKNISGDAVSIPKIVVAARDPDWKNVNFDTVYNIELEPGESYNYSKSRAFSKPGEYHMWIAAHDGSRWSGSWPGDLYRNIIRDRTINIAMPKIRAGGDVDITPASRKSGATYTAQFSIKNNELATITIPKLVLAVRDSAGRNMNFDTVADITIGPQEWYTYSQSQVLPKADSYHYWIVSYFDDRGWVWNWPRGASSSYITSGAFRVVESDVNVTQGISLNPSSPVVGAPTTGTFTIKNNDSVPVTIPKIVLAVRSPSGANVNFDTAYNIVLGPGETYAYTKSRTFTEPGAHTIWISSYDNTRWSRSWPQANGNTTDSIFTVTN